MSEKVAKQATKKDAVRKHTEESDDSAPEVKRGRGRPKKDPSFKKAAPIVTTNPDGTEKKRGRPKGASNKEGLKKAAGAKTSGRGRPSKKKESEDEHDDEEEEEEEDEA